MWTKHKQQNGFTIVELLIVIVVIGVLAAITIVAYNGVQGRARATSLISDLSNASRQLKIAQVTDGAYPVSLQSSSSGTIYQVSVNNSVNPQTFCITGTNGPLSYKITQDGAPAQGGCPGHGQGGTPPITNLVINPSLESDASGWTKHALLNGGRTQVNGKWVFSATRSGTGATAIYTSQTPGATVTAGATYTGSALVTSSVTQTIRIAVRPTGTSTDMFSTDQVIQANTPTRLSASGNVTSASVFVTIWWSGGAVGDTVTADEVMITSGATTYGYADGNSTDWTWNGTVNNSTSAGPVL